MPVLPIVRCQSFEQAVEDAVVAEHGNRHTASIFSKDVDHMTRFARVIETTIYVKNSATKAGVGIGGEGHCTMTIAGPTGEGITCAKSFCRRRRCNPQRVLPETPPSAVPAGRTSPAHSGEASLPAGLRAESGCTSH